MLEWDKEKSKKLTIKLYELHTTEKRNELLREEDLTNIGFSINMTNLDFSGKDMTGCLIANTASYNVNFSGAKLYNATIYDSALFNSNFEDVEFAGATLSAYNFAGSSFKNAKFQQAYVEAYFDKCNIKNAVFSINTHQRWKFEEKGKLYCNNLVMSIEEWEDFFRLNKTIGINEYPHSLQSSDSLRYGMDRSAFYYMKTLGEYCEVNDKVWESKYHEDSRGFLVCDEDWLYSE